MPDFCEFNIFQLMYMYYHLGYGVMRKQCDKIVVIQVHKKNKKRQNMYSFISCT